MPATTLFEKYMKHTERDSIEMVLETAAADHEITDSEYEKLVKAAAKASKDRKSANHAKRMADREKAKESLYV